LTTAIQVKNLTRIKVQAVHYEANAERGQEWVEVYAETGFMDTGIFYAYPNPATGKSVVYFKFENGCHPERPGMMLGRCEVCMKWAPAVSGTCDEPGCGGAIAAFPSYSRFRNRIDASVERDVFLATEAFLVNKDGTEGQPFPNPDDFEDVRPLVDGTA